MATHNTNGGDNSGDRPMHRRHQRQQHQQGRPRQHHLSANHIEFNDLRSRHRELTQKVGSLRSENRRLKSRRTVTDDAIEGFAGDSPRRALAQINRNHAKDLEFYNEQLDENERLISDAEYQLHEKQAELQRLRDELKWNKKLIDSDRHLPDRQHMQDRLEEVKKDIAEKDERIRDLDNQVTDLRRQHRAKLNEEKLHNKELHHQIESVQEQIQELQTQMKHTKSDYEHRWIYAQRVRLLRMMTPQLMSNRSSPSLSDTVKMNPDFYGVHSHDDLQRILREQAKEDERLNRERLERELMRVGEAERRRNEGKREHKHGSSGSNNDDDVEKIVSRALGEDTGRRVDDRIGAPQKAELLYATNDARSDADAALNNAEKNVSSTGTPTIVERVVQSVDDGATETRRGVGYL